MREKKEHYMQFHVYRYVNYKLSPKVMYKASSVKH